jgi:regulator of cell morphogenesis and NO signaling
MSELSGKTINQIIKEHPKTKDVFETFNLDYFKMGNLSLQEACTELSINVADIEKALQDICDANSNELNFHLLKLYQVADYIVFKYHSYIKKTIPVIQSYLDKVVIKHGKQIMELAEIKGLFSDIVEELEAHIKNEVEVVFPRIKQLEQNGFEPVPFDIRHYRYLELPIIDMVDDDEFTDNKMSEIRRLTQNYSNPLPNCNTTKLLYRALHEFETIMHQYIYLENFTLFPRALELEKQYNATFR